MDIYTVSLIPGLCLVSFCIGVMVSIPLTYSCITQGVKTYEKSVNTESCEEESCQEEESCEEECCSDDNGQSTEDCSSEEEYESPSDSSELRIHSKIPTTLKITFDKEHNRTVVSVEIDSKESQEQIPSEEEYYESSEDEDLCCQQSCEEKSQDVQLVNELDKKQN